MFKQGLDQTDWNYIINQEDAQMAYTLFSNKVVSLYNQSFPVKDVKVRKRPCNPWMTIGLKKSIHHKNKLYFNFKKKRTVYNEIQYKLYKNKLKHLIQETKKLYYQELLCKNKSNLRESWRILKEIIGNGRQCKCNTQFLIEGNVIDNAQIIVENFNKFFVNIGTRLADNIPSVNKSPNEYLKGTYPNSLYFSPVLEDELKCIVKNLKLSASGIDGIQPNIFKNVFSALQQPLLHVINLSFIQGVFPNELKSACVIPIFKGGDPKLIQNYRPVSVLPVISKIFERVMYNRLVKYLEKYNILYKYQFGFKSNHSTYMALTLLVDKILSALDNNEHVIGLYLDFAKAFDTVNHQILLSKLSHYGIRGNMLKWFESYLMNRKQVVKYNDMISKEMLINCGVPQGSILGPILFLIYINDLSTVSNILFTLMFADDTNMFIQGKNIKQMEDCMNNELINIVKWLHCNKLSLNIGKTHTMLFTGNKHMHIRSNNIYIEGITIETVVKTKFLGVIIDNKLTWKEHINYICNKISKGIGIIKKVRDILSKDTLLGLYYTFIYPYLSYCNIIWGRAANIYLNRLFILQKRIMRIICKTHYLAHTESLFQECKVLNVYKINSYSIGIFMYKYCMGLLPRLFDNMFVIQNEHHRYETRYNASFSLPFCRTQSRKNSLYYQGAYFWNNFTKNNPDIEKTYSIFSFKKLLRQSLWLK